MDVYTSKTRFVGGSAGTVPWAYAVNDKRLSWVRDVHFAMKTARFAINRSDFAIKLAVSLISEKKFLAFALLRLPN